MGRDAPALRFAGPGDLDAIRHCAEAAYAPYVPRIGRRPAPMDADFAALIDAGHVAVIKADGMLAAYVVSYPRGDHLQVENIAVAPSHQGRGLGRLMLAWAEQRACEAGRVAVELYTNAAMTENLTLYPQLGYRETMRGEEAGFSRVYFRKELADDEGPVTSGRC